MPQDSPPNGEIAKLHNCQTPKCPNVYEAVVLWVGDSKAQYFCVACFCAFFARVVQGLADAADQAAQLAPAATLVQNAPTG